MSEVLRIGYMPLVDAGLLLAASELGFFRDAGLDVELVRETSWANIRDKLALGFFDAAHMLTPAAIACSLGVAQLRVPLTAVCALGLNGNAITVSTTLFAQMRDRARGNLRDPNISAQALATLVAERGPGAPLTIGYVFPYATHLYQLRLWLQAGGIDPERDVALVVLPPPLMVRALESGAVEGFCVGAPWSSIAVDHGLGVIAHLGTEIVSDCPEKILAVRSDWASVHSESVAALRAAVLRAATWLRQPGHMRDLAGMIAAIIPETTEALVAHVLDGTLRIGWDGQARHDAAYMRLDPDALRPHRAQAEWLLTQMHDARQIENTPETRALVARVMGLDAATSDANVPTPRNFPGVKDATPPDYAYDLGQSSVRRASCLPYGRTCLQHGLDLCGRRC